MRRTHLAILMACGAAALPALAPATAQGTYRERSVVVYGNDPCPKAANPDEIVVCARRPEEERFRIPRSVREQEAEAIARRDNVAAGRAELASGRPSATGIGSCSAVGPGGALGCTQGLDVARAARVAKEGVERAVEPDDK
jgi:hypothetical protein